MTDLLTAARAVVAALDGYDPHPEGKAALATLAAVVQRYGAIEQADAIAAKLGGGYSYDADKGEVTLTLDGQKQLVKVGSPFWARLAVWAQS